ncbi:hypothetical protein ACJU26_01795 [Acidithiobacillus sp. M4-SHS-6]|uniref:hypothetical protein n=1 Tax=Acidithiobacillus sp. M4-SHS-6 TaxID=3383024 RepID=UPI0039BDE338
MENAFLRLFASVSASNTKSEGPAVGKMAIQVPRGKYAYLPVRANGLSWLKGARVYLCLSRTSTALLLPWWRYPQARWGVLSADLRAWARFQQKNEEQFHILAGGNRLFYSRLLRPKRRLVAEIAFRVPAGDALPWSEIRSLVSQVMTQVPFIPPLDAEDRRLARLLLLDKRGRELAMALGWTASKVRSRLARLARLFGADSNAELMDCLWLAHQRKSFNKDME